MSHSYYDRALKIMEVLRSLPGHERNHGDHKIEDVRLGYYDGDKPSHIYFVLKFDGLEVTFFGPEYGLTISYPDYVKLEDFSLQTFLSKIESLVEKVRNRIIISGVEYDLVPVKK